MNVVYAVLLCLAFAAVELLIGGTRLVFALPAYGLLGIAGVLSVVDLRRPKLPANGTCLAASALFFGYILARSLASPVDYLAWSDRFMVLGALVVYLLTACFLTDPRRRLWVLAGLLAMAVVNLCVGAQQFASGQADMLFGFIRSAQYARRASGLYICPDHMAGYLEVMACLTLAAALWSRVRPWLKLLLGYLALCCLAGIVITGSRGGLLSVAAGLSVLTILGLLRVRSTSPGLLPRTLLAVAVVGVAAVVALGFTLRHSSLLRERTSLDVARTDVRPLLWPSAVREWEVSPVVGTGSSTFLYYGRKFRDPRVQSDPVRPHNDYLELLAEYGAVGVAGFLLFLGAHLRWGWRAFRHLSTRADSFGGGPGGSGSNAAAWNIGALAAVACLVAHSVVDFNLHIPANALLLAFVFGVLANPGRALGGGDQVARLRPVDYLPRAALLGISVWLLAEGLPKLPGEAYAEQARVAVRDGQSKDAILLSGQALDPAGSLVETLGDWSAPLVNLLRPGLESVRRDPLPSYYLGEANLQLATATVARGADRSDLAVAQTFYEAAEDPYRDAVTLCPQDSIMLMRLGETLTRLGKLDEAGPIFDRLLAWDPDSGMAQTYDGFYLQCAGRLDEAAAAYRRGLQLDPQPAAVRGLEEIARLRREASPPAGGGTQGAGGL